MTSGLWQYIAGYIVATVWRYPISRHVIFVGALEFFIYPKLYLFLTVPFYPLQHNEKLLDKRQFPCFVLRFAFSCIDYMDLMLNSNYNLPLLSITLHVAEDWLSGLNKWANARNDGNDSKITSPKQLFGFSEGSWLFRPSIRSEWLGRQ